MDEWLFGVVLWYPIFLVPAILGSILVLLGLRKHITFTIYHLFYLIMPWLVWITLTTYDGTGKSLSNLIEAVILGALVAVLFLVEGMLSRLKNISWVHYSKFALGFNCIIAVSLWLFVPGLPE